MLGTIKFVDKDVIHNSACRLYHRDVIASRSEVQCVHWCGAQRSSTSNWVKVIYSSSFGIRRKPTYGLNSWRHMHQILQNSLCPRLVQSMRLHLVKYRGGDNTHWIPKNKMTVTAVHWELCGTNFRVISLPREQGEWLRQNPSVARILTALFALLPLVLDKQHPRRPVIIP